MIIASLVIVICCYVFGVFFTGFFDKYTQIGIYNGRSQFTVHIYKVWNMLFGSFTGLLIYKTSFFVGIAGVIIGSVVLSVVEIKLLKINYGEKDLLRFFPRLIVYKLFFFVLGTIPALLFISSF